MNKIRKMKEVEYKVNEFWRVKGKYYIRVLEVNDTENIIVSIHDNDTDELILDFNTVYSDYIEVIVTALIEELIKYINDFTNRIRPISDRFLEKDSDSYIIDFNLYIREANFYYEWLDIFEMMSEYLRKQVA